MERKKGIQLSQAFGAVLTLVLVAVLVIIAIVLFVTLSTSFEGTSALSEINESVDMTNGANSVANATLCGFGDFAISQVYNGTGDGDILLTSDNYSTTAAGLIINTSEGESQAWAVTWTGTWGSDACTSSDNMTTEFANYTSLIGLVGTIIFLGLVIGILVVSFAFGERNKV